MNRRPKVGLALGGGGARGLAHIGVLKVLERAGIPIDLIVGTSMGALAGAAYAVRPDASALEKQVLDFFSEGSKHSSSLKRLGVLHPHSLQKKDFMHRLVRIAEKHLFLSLAILRKALVGGEEMRELLGVFLPDIDIRETLIPFTAIAVDLVSGKEVALDSGSLIHAVMASCAVPGFLPSVSWKEMVLVDGGVLDAVPARPAKARGADVVIGVDVGFCLCHAPPIEDGIDAINRATEIMSYYLCFESRRRADVLIEPGVKETQWNDFHHYQELIASGEQAAESRIEEIRELLGLRGAKKVLGRLKKRLPGLKKGRFDLGKSLKAPKLSDASNARAKG